jgi:hypothetical protein
MEAVAEVCSAASPYNHGNDVNFVGFLSPSNVPWLCSLVQQLAAMAAAFSISLALTLYAQNYSEFLFRSVIVSKDSSLNFFAIFLAMFKNCMGSIASDDVVILNDVFGTKENQVVTVCFKVGYHPSIYLEELSRDSSLRAKT